MSDALVLDKRLKASEVAELLGITDQTVYKYARLGIIPCVKVGRHRIRFKLSDIQRWEAQNTTGKF